MNEKMSFNMGVRFVASFNMGKNFLDVWIICLSTRSELLSV